MVPGPKSDLAPLGYTGLYTYWETGGGALDLSKELVGQPTRDGGPWGTPAGGDDGYNGDFSLFFTNGGPLGSNYFTLTTDGGDSIGDSILLTEFAPVTTSTPEPGSLALVGSGLALLAGAIRRRFSL